MRTTVYDRTWLEKARKQKGVTQESVEQASGITTAYYNRIEKGVYMPRVDTGLKICNFLGIDAKNFLRERQIP